ncbi:phage capsid protein [Gramella jeungdoensis]|uniref:Phage capsid protein n=1 Tax=Gramella jeungdoensis TaxID=708091 RepID=A0A4Y8AMT5_9FLAO|nr:major capsid protein [Gramella jeungdoensis]TEW71385.1 phage capsid protein [Gramella jeungdoensis]
MAKNSARFHRKNNRFSQIPNSPIQRSVFDRSHDYKTTMDSGYLIPFFVDEVLPGDTFKLRVNAFVRMNTLVAPFMDNVFMDTFFFFVPTRLVWDNWQRFCGEQKNPGDSTDFLIPSLSGTNTFANGTIFDYMGLPTGVSLDPANTPINALPFRAYNLIYNEWFRDENLIDSIPVLTSDGPDPVSNYTLRKRAKRHDYFTSALPWPQKGPSVDVGLTGNAPIVGFGDSHSWTVTSSTSNSPSSNSWQFGKDNGVGFQAYLDAKGPAGVNMAQVMQHKSESGWSEVVVQNSTGDSLRNISSIRGTNGSFYELNKAHLFPEEGFSPYADLSGVSAITINDLRQAFQIQKFYEKWARGGSRYTETLRVMFNVISPDARLQRPEYLGGTHSRVNVVPTAQTSSTDSVSPQSNLSAFGVLGDSAHGFNKSFVEHGYVIGLVSLRADITYQQGLNRMWSRRQLFDFYWPTLAHLGEQVVYNKEIYAQGTAEDNGVFGYQERYAEYRYKPSMITGKLRSTDAQTLDVWHLAQKFETLPKLNQDFIEENPPIDRVIAVQNEPQFFADFWFDLKTSRPMPVYSVPGLVDHF